MRFVYFLIVVGQAAFAFQSDWESRIEKLEKAVDRAGRAGYAVAQACSGRLTLQSGTAVSTSDQTAKGTLYFTPYQGGRISLYDGSKWVLSAFTERSLALSISSGSNYDVFLYDNSGTLTLELSSAWTNDTTRADALTTQDGIYVKSGSTTRRYLGTIRGSAANQTEDSRSKRFVWNECGRTRRSLLVIDTTNDFNYNLTSWRAANNSSANKVEFVVGRSDVLIMGDVYTMVSGGGASSGIGLDSTSTNSAEVFGAGNNSTGLQNFGKMVSYPSAGYHYLQWLETAVGGVNYWYGDNAGNGQSGMSAWLEG